MFFGFVSALGPATVSNINGPISPDAGLNASSVTGIEFGVVDGLPPYSPVVVNPQ